MKKLVLIFLLLLPIVTNSQLLPQLRSPDCGRTNVSFYLTLYANLTGGTQYKFKVTNLDLGITDSIVSPDRGFRLIEIPSVARYNSTHQVQVCIDNGSGFGEYGNPCTVTTSPLYTQLRSVDCGRSLTAINYPVYANQTVADYWDFEVRIQSDPGTSEQVLNRPTRMFRLTMAGVNFQQYGTEYEVRCRISRGGVLQPWGNWCSITTPDIAPPSIIDGCNQTFEKLAYEYITCTDIPEAVTYRWRLRIGTTQIDTVNTSTNQVRIVDFINDLNQPMYNYGQTYNISAQIFDGIAWTSYGSACNITITPEPYTELLPAISPCGSTVASLNTPIYMYAIFHATNYEYEVVDLTTGPYSDGVQILNKPTKTFKLNELPNYSYGHEYQIRCRVTYEGVQYNYGPACSIFAPPPVISLRSPDCPKTLTSLNQMVYANNALTFDNPSGLDPVNTYKFKTNGVESAWQSFRGTTLQNILGSPPAYNTSYTVYVKTTYDGVEQPYGNGCVITTPSAIVIDPTIRPNPFSNTFKIENIETTNPILITDLSGKTIETITDPTGELGSNLSSGFYYVVIENQVYKIFKN